MYLQEMDHTWHMMGTGETFMDSIKILNGGKLSKWQKGLNFQEHFPRKNLFIFLISDLD